MEKYISGIVLLTVEDYTTVYNSNPILKKGFPVICTIPIDDNQSTQIMLKVGDGTTSFRSLPWLSGLSADVHEWALQENKPSYTASEISGLGTASAANTGTSEGNVPVIQADGKLLASIFPDLSSTYVPTSRTINNKSLSSNITLSASDVSAAPSTHVSGVASATALGHIKVGSGLTISADGTLSVATFDEITIGNIKLVYNAEKDAIDFVKVT